MLQRDTNSYGSPLKSEVACFIYLKKIVSHIIQIRVKRRFIFLIYLALYHETVKLIITL